MNLENAIIIKKLPEIEQYLAPISAEIDKMVENALKKVENATDDDKKDLKKTRTEINQIKEFLENKRKDVKEQIEKPYKEFNAIYNDLIKSRLEMAENGLKQAIDTIEARQKDEIRSKMVEFFNEYCEYYHIEQIIDFDDVGLNITLSASEKSLKTQIISFCEKVSEDLVAISSCKNREEVLYEYQHNGFNYARAINSCEARLNEIINICSNMEQVGRIVTEEEAVVRNVEQLVSAPIEIKEEEKITATFTIVDTKENIVKVRDFMKENNINYE